MDKCTFAATRAHLSPSIRRPGNLSCCQIWDGLSPRLKRAGFTGPKQKRSRICKSSKNRCWHGQLQQTASDSASAPMPSASNAISDGKKEVSSLEWEKVSAPISGGIRPYKHEERQFHDLKEQKNLKQNNADVMCAKLVESKMPRVKRDAHSMLHSFERPAAEAITALGNIGDAKHRYHDSRSCTERKPSKRRTTTT